MKKSSKYRAIIEFGSAAIKILIVRNEKGSFVNPKYHYYPISTVDEQRREEKLFSSLIKATKELPLSACQIYLCLSSEDFKIKHITLPFMPIDEVEGAVAWHLKTEKLLSECVSDFRVNEVESEPGGSKEYDTRITLAEKKVVSQYIDILQRAGIEPEKVVDVACGYESVAPAISKANDISTFAIVEVGRLSTHIYVLNNNQICFTRRIAVGSQDKTEALTGKLFSDTNSFQLSFDEAELIKKEVGIPNEDDVIMDGKVKGHWILSLMRPTIENIAGELKASIEYFEDTIGSGRIEKIFLASGGGLLKNFPAYVERMTGISTDLLLNRYWQADMTAGEQEDPQMTINFGGLAGYTVKSPVKINNLLPQAYVYKRLHKLQRSFIRVFSIVAFALIALSFIVSRTQLFYLQALLKTTRHHKNMIHQVREMQSKIIQRGGVIDKIQSRETPTTLIMKEIGYLLPEQLILTKILIDHDKGHIEFWGNYQQGPAPFEDALSAFIENLNRGRFLKKATLQSSEQSVQNETPVFAFAIRAEIVGVS